MTPREARARARTILRELLTTPSRLPSHQDNPDYLDRAAVLADVVLQSDRPEVGEALALAVQGRVSGYPGRFVRLGVGAKLPPGTETTELVNAVDAARFVLSPQRSAPCMPNRAALEGLVRDVQGDEVETRRVFRRLWASLQEACEVRTPSNLDRALSVANDTIGGYGVESMEAWDFRRDEDGPIAVIDYVNMGDTYNLTLVFFRRWNLKHVWRFEVTDWGSAVEALERRYPRAAWRQH